MSAPQYDGLDAPASRHALFPFIAAGLRDKKRQDVSVLEVGSFMGHSALSWANAIANAGMTGRVVCVDPWRPYFRDVDIRSNVGVAVQHVMMTSGHIKRRFDENIRFAPAGVDIIALQTTLEAALPILAPHSFDAVYIDGSHYYADVAANIRSALAITKPDGVICGDDMELTPADVWPLSDEQCAGDTVVLSDGRWLHAGVTRAVGEAFDHADIHAEAGFWWVDR